MIDLEDLNLAKNVRKRAKCNYSKYSVGVVLKTKDGKRYCGCNIENDGIQSICAERVAFVKAISEGEKDFESILILGAPSSDMENFKRTLPCGYCRQFMSEFVDKNFKIFTSYGNKIEEYTIEELFPYEFHL